MDLLTFKDSLYVGLEFQKPNVASTILEINDEEATHLIGKNGRSKKVRFDVLNAAFQELFQNQSFTKKWFTEMYPTQAKTSPCNYTTIGGLFQHFNLATYTRGEYKEVKK